MWPGLRLHINYTTLYISYLIVTLYFFVEISKSPVSSSTQTRMQGVVFVVLVASMVAVALGHDNWDSNSMDNDQFGKLISEMSDFPIETRITKP